MATKIVRVCDKCKCEHSFNAGMGDDSAVLVHNPYIPYIDPLNRFQIIVPGGLSHTYKNVDIELCDECADKLHALLCDNGWWL